MNELTLLRQAFDPVKDQDVIRQAALLLRQGELVVFPTETVYGIGANALDSTAVSRIFQAKGRPADNPLIAHIADKKQLKELVACVPLAAEKLMERFWPGPLTIILPKGGAVPDNVSAGLDTVAVRMPCHPIAAAILVECGLPVAAPSANRSGRPSPTTAEHCIKDLQGRVSLIVDGGHCPVGVESTVVTVAGEVPRLLRPGAVTLEQLRQALGEVEVDYAISHHVEDNIPVASPGMKYKHYAPKAQVVLVNGSAEQLREFLLLKQDEGIYALVFDEDLQEMPVKALSYGPAADSEAQASRLFAALRELDARGAVRVYARTPKKSGIGLAVYNRLVRAAGFSEITL